MPTSQVPEDWPQLSDDELMGLRMADLPLQIEGTALEELLKRLGSELEARGLILPIHFYISTEWFTPDGMTSMAVPFYMTHPRLERLEKAQMLAVEGEDPEWCMRILRHESGHIVDNAFKLRLRRRRRELFGPSSLEYPEFYDPKPYSRSFVLHLDPWYAQSHPDEDFAETFAVWLAPESDWRARYEGWHALTKLEYMDELMGELRGKEPRVVDPTEVDPLRRIRRTLGYHYRQRRKQYGVDRPTFYDRDLRRLFSDAPDFGANMTAAQFITKIRKPVRRLVSSWTGIYQYTVDRVLEDMIYRCRELKLRLAVPEETALHEFTVLLTVQAMNYLHNGSHRMAL
jgi:hypothetical protein